MCNYLANFIRSGDPNGSDADGTPMPAWKPFTEASPDAMRWGDAAEPYVDEASPLMKLLVKAWIAKN